MGISFLVVMGASAAAEPQAINPSNRYWIFRLGSLVTPAIVSLTFAYIVQLCSAVLAKKLSQVRHITALNNKHLTVGMLFKIFELMGCHNVSLHQRAITERASLMGCCVMQRYPALRPHVPWLIYGGLSLAVSSLAVLLLGYPMISDLISCPVVASLPGLPSGT